MIAVTEVCDWSHSLLNGRNSIVRFRQVVMAASEPEQLLGAEFFSRAGKNIPLKTSSCFLTILVLCSGWFVCPICCATESLTGRCSSGVETRSRPIASTIPTKSVEAGEGHSCLKQNHQTQPSPSSESLSKPAARPPCCSCDAQTNSRAVLSRLGNRSIATNVIWQTAICEGVKQRFQCARFAPVMNRGSTYLLFCVLLI